MDIKPGNVLVDIHGKLKLIDFGASKQMKLEGGATTNTQAAYTTGYAPLEQVSQRLEDVGPWTDLYAVGALCYRLLTNQKLPECYDILLKRDAAFSFPKTVSENAKKLIKWMMQPNHNDRPQSVAQVIDRIQPKPIPEQKQAVQSIPADSEVTIIKDSSEPKIEPAPTNDHIVASPEQSMGDDLGGVRFFQGKSIPKIADIELIVRRFMRNMVQVDAGEFVMGCVSGRDGQGFGDEYPAHRVHLSSFYICRYLVTQDEWETVMGENPSKFKGYRHPVTNVNWLDCQEFIRRLNQVSGKTFRLPTEAEWEFAARGGRFGQGTLYAGSDRLDEVAWYEGNANRRLREVGLLQPNELGLYDMSGNVHEWCADNIYRYGIESERDPVHIDNSSNRRITRGGCWLNGAGFMRIAQRSSDNQETRTSTIGLRLAMTTKE